MYSLEVWSDVECAGGSRLAWIHPINEGVITLAVSADDRLTATAPRLDGQGVEYPWVALASFRRVVRAEDEDTGDVSEWRISRVNEIRNEEGDLVIVLQADPILLDLGSTIVGNEVTGGSTFFNLGAVKLSIQQVVDSFVLPALTARGITWVERGTIGVNQPIELSWESASPLEICRALQEQSGTELSLTRNGGSLYELNFSTIGSGVTLLPAEFGRNIRGLSKDVRPDNFASVLIPKGRMPEGAIELGGIDDAVWEITGKSGNDLTLQDPLGGDGPVKYTDQFKDQYLEAAGDLSTLQIDSCTAAGVFTMTSTPSAFSVGDLVRVVKDSSGTALVELPRPASVAEYGEVVGRVLRPDQPTGRSLVPAGAMGPNLWDTHAPGVAMVRGQIDGTHSATTAVSLKALPVGTVIDEWDVIHINDGSPNYAEPKAEVAGGGGDTVGGDGLASLTTDQAVTAADDDPAWVAVGQKIKSGDPLEGRWPEDTLRVFRAGFGDPNNFGCCGIWDRAELPTAPNTDSCQYAGAHTSGVTEIQVDGLPILKHYPWALFDAAGDGSSILVITHAFTTTADGVAVFYTTSFPTSMSDNDPCGIIEPYLEEHVRGGRYALVLGRQEAAGAVRWAWDNLSFAIKYVPSRATVYYSAGFSHFARVATTYSQANAPYLELHHRQLGSGDSFTNEQTKRAGDDETTALTPYHINLTGSFSIDEDKEAFLRVYMPFLGSVGPDPGWPIGNELNLLRYLAVWLGPDTSPPIVEGSHANALWQHANDQIDVVGIPWTSYEISLRDLAHVPGFDASEEALVLGATVPIRDEVLGDISARIMGITWDLIDPSASTIVLQTPRPRATARLIGSRYSVRRPEEGATIELTGPEAQPAVREISAYRSEVPFPDFTGGLVAPEEWSSD